jgi:hypothetical protein
MRGKRGKEEGKPGNAAGPDTRNGKSLQPEREREEKPGRSCRPGTGTGNRGPCQPGPARKSRNAGPLQIPKGKREKEKSQGTDHTAPRLFIILLCNSS